MFSGGFQEDGKSDFGMKVNELRYPETSLQSTKNLELEPAIDCSALPGCLPLPPGFLRQQLLSHSDTPVLPAVPTAPPPPGSPRHTGDSRRGTWSGKKSVATCCQSPIHIGTCWQRKAKKAWGGFFL